MYQPWYDPYETKIPFLGDTIEKDDEDEAPVDFNNAQSNKDSYELG